MKNILLLCLLLISFSCFSQLPKWEKQPEIAIQGMEHTYSFSVPNAPDSIPVTVNENFQWIQKDANGHYSFSHTTITASNVSVGIGGEVLESHCRAIPLWVSVLPPLLAILMALIFKEVISALFIGIFFGAGVIGYFQNGFSGILSGFFDVITKYILGALYSTDHLSVILFSLLIGGVVAVISKNGGMQGVVNKIAKRATSPKTGQMATYLLGIGIFFDDYANTLVVGNTMRPITDKLKISREKLAYIVDSTAAPVAALAFVTTWIGAELGYIQDGIKNIAEGGDIIHAGAYSVFLSSLQYSFYPILTLIFIFMLIRFGKDFGPMLSAEKVARGKEEIESNNAEVSDELKHFNPKEGVTVRPINAILPIVTIIVGTIAGLGRTGYLKTQTVWESDISLFLKISETLGAADSYSALMWASLAGLAVAIGLSVSQKLLSLQESFEAMTSGFKAMISAVIILTLAWSLASVTEELHTADFLSQLLSDSIAPWLIPTVTFLLAALIAFSTGTSWGTMAILYPLALPATWSVCQAAGLPLDDTLPLFYNVVSCVLAGSVLGDHCSPISDTTILSSLASSCNHIAHVKTQMPYALTVGGVAICLGTIPAAFGVPTWILFPIAITVLFFIVKRFGKTIGEVQ